MNKQSLDIMHYLINEKYTTQRNIALKTKYSIGAVNKSLNDLLSKGMIDSKYSITEKGVAFCENNRPKRAVILAAGYGMRMVPINFENSKAFLEIQNETLIERIIKQLHDVDIREIYVVVGYMKEKFEYLIDRHNVKLIFNKDYSNRNNLHSLYLAKDYISDCYIIPCDIWCKNNVFDKTEFYSWYSLNNEIKKNALFKSNRKQEIVRCQHSENGNQSIGIAYVSHNNSKEFIDDLITYDSDFMYLNSNWENILLNNNLKFYSRFFHKDDVIEINTYEQLRELDCQSNNLQSEIMDVIVNVLNVNKNSIHNIETLKKGMTNRSFKFECNKKMYIMRIPGEGTENLIDRKKESRVYDVLLGKNISDKVLYINPHNGYKLTEFIYDARVCNPYDDNDVTLCMRKLKNLHSMRLIVDHEFNIYNQIDYYEKLWGNNKSIYRDYKETKGKVLTLKNYVEKNIEYKCLTHIDAVPDNFLITEYNGKSEVKLIDWEYAGMQDPHVDIAMFCIYAMYNKNQVDKLIDIYFNNECKKNIRIKIYCYISLCGLLWSNWCEYKRLLGVEFGEYSLKQYRYAKEYYKYVLESLEKEK